MKATMQLRKLDSVPTVNLKSDLPTVREALSRLSRELAFAREHGDRVIKLIHGYGSTGVGGEIRVAVQARLQDMTARGEIQACIFGEDWAKSDAQTWKLLRSHPSLKSDPHLGRKNLGITIVVL
jgi:hypothetical protein